MKIKLAAVQFLPEAGNIPSNLERMEKLIASASKKGAGLVVLPEICDIGYDLEVVKKLAVTYKDSSAGSFSKMAKKNNIIVVAGMAERKKEGLFNGLYVFDPKGALAGKYYKSHLCAVPPFNEPADFCAGDSLHLIKAGGLNIGPAICFDCRFPELYRKLAVLGAELICQPTAFPMSRIEQMEVCMRARTIENQFFAVTANYCGKFGGVAFGGNSLILGPGGKIIAKADNISEQVVVGEIDLAEISLARKNAPVFDHRREELYRS